MKKKILITGGLGFLGVHCIEKWKSLGYDVHVIDNLSTGFKKLIFKKIKFYKLDIRHTNKLKKIIYKEKIDTIIHLAAKLSLQEAQRRLKQYKSVNIDGTKSVLEAIKVSNVKRLIFSSTAAVYSGNKNVSCSEKLKSRLGFKVWNAYGRIESSMDYLIDIEPKRIKELKPTNKN